MPRKPARPCLGCGAKTTRGSRCAKCERERERTKAPSPHRNGSTREWRKTRYRILERDGFRCTHVDSFGRRCPSTLNLHVDHVHPKSKGGTDDDSNLVTLCRTHNLRKGAKVPRGRGTQGGGGGGR